jgi:hypothetical protein
LVLVVLHTLLEQQGQMVLTLYLVLSPQLAVVLVVVLQLVVLTLTQVAQAVRAVVVRHRVVLGLFLAVLHLLLVKVLLVVLLLMPIRRHTVVVVVAVLLLLAVMAQVLLVGQVVRV